MHTIAFLSMIIAGGTHLWLVPQYWSVVAVHALLLGAIGFLQIVWSLAFYRRPTENLYRWGIYLAGGSVMLWLITRVAPVPFASIPDIITAAEVVVKLAELHALGAVAAWAYKEPYVRLKPVAYSLGAIGWGAAVYMLGWLVEWVV